MTKRQLHRFFFPKPPKERAIFFRITLLLFSQTAASTLPASSTSFVVNLGVP